MMRKNCLFWMAAAAIMLMVNGCGDDMGREGYDGKPCEGNTEGLVFANSLTPIKVTESLDIANSGHCSKSKQFCVLYENDKYACSEYDAYGTLNCGGSAKNVLVDSDNCGACDKKCDGNCENGVCTLNEEVITYKGKMCQENTKGLVFTTSLVPNEIADSAKIIETGRCPEDYPNCVLYGGDEKKYACSENSAYGELKCGGIIVNTLVDNTHCGACNKSCNGECVDGVCNEYECDGDGKRCIENELQFCDNHRWAKEKDCDYKCEINACIHCCPTKIRRIAGSNF